MPRTPLLATHQRLGASLEETEGWLLPARFTDPAQEYEAAVSAVALVDRSAMGRLRVTGKDALDLLNRLSTNKVDALSPGEGAGTVLTTNKGRMVDVVVVTALPDHCLLLTSPARERVVAQWIDRYTFLEECRVQDITRRTACIGILGPGASRLLGHLSGTTVAALERWHNRIVTIAGTEVVVLRTDAAGIRGYDLVGSRSRARGVWNALLRRGARYGLRPLGQEAWEMLRIQHGVGRYGREYSEAYNPLEAQLLGLISFNKGCYIGQEVVARLNTYRKVQRRLVGLEVAASQSPPAGSRVQVDGKDIGTITSAAQTPGGERPLALAYLRKGYVRPGTSVEVEVDGHVRSAVVVKLPPR